MSNYRMNMNKNENFGDKFATFNPSKEDDPMISLRSYTADSQTLLEELDISPEKIKERLIHVFLFFKPKQLYILDDLDFSGPLLLFVLLGVFLLLVT